MIMTPYLVSRTSIKYKRRYNTPLNPRPNSRTINNFY